MFNNIEILIFDLDETLIDEKKYREEALLKTIYYLSLKKNLSCTKINKKMYLKFKKKIFEPKLISQLANELDQKISKYEIKQIFDSITNFGDIDDKFKLIKFFKKKYKIALITDGNYFRQFNKLYVTKFLKFFDIIIINDKKKRMKPSLYAFKKVIKKLKAKPENCVYIADNPKKDFLAPKKMNIKTIRLMAGKYKKLKSSNEINLQIKELKNLVSIIN